MTCHHKAGDPACSSHYLNHNNPAQVALREVEARTPDAKKFEILDVAVRGPHLVVKVLYPNCAKCSYEGTKVMVFLNCSTLDAIKWRMIDPHFRPFDQSRNPKESPGPDARFPASDVGWQDAIAYADSKTPLASRR